MLNVRILDFHQNNLHVTVISTVTLTLASVFEAMITYSPASLLVRFSGNPTSSPSLNHVMLGIG